MNKLRLWTARGRAANKQKKDEEIAARKAARAARRGGDHGAGFDEDGRKYRLCRKCGGEL